MRLHELDAVADDVVDLLTLKRANLVPSFAEKVKVIDSGKVTKAVKLKGIAVTPGARKAIEAAGGSIEA